MPIVLVLKQILDFSESLFFGPLMRSFKVETVSGDAVRDLYIFSLTILDVVRGAQKLKAFKLKVAAFV